MYKVRRKNPFLEKSDFAVGSGSDVVAVDAVAVGVVVGTVATVIDIVVCCC